MVDQGNEDSARQLFSSASDLVEVSDMLATGQHRRPPPPARSVQRANGPSEPEPLAGMTVDFALDPATCAGPALDRMAALLGIERREPAPATSIAKYKPRSEHVRELLAAFELKLPELRLPALPVVPMTEFLDMLATLDAKVKPPKPT